MSQKTTHKHLTKTCHSNWRQNPTKVQHIINHNSTIWLNISQHPTESSQSQKQTSWRTSSILQCVEELPRISEIEEYKINTSLSWSSSRKKSQQTTHHKPAKFYQQDLAHYRYIYTYMPCHAMPYHSIPFSVIILMNNTVIGLGESCLRLNNKVFKVKELLIQV